MNCWVSSVLGGCWLLLQKQPFCFSLPEKGGCPLSKVLPSFILSPQFYLCYLNSILLINFMSSSAVSKTYINLYHLSTSFIKPFNLCKAFLPGHQRDCVLAADRAAFPPAASNELSNTVPHSFLSTSPSPNKRRQGKEKKPKMVKRKQRKWK